MAKTRRKNPTSTVKHSKEKSTTSHRNQKSQKEETKPHSWAVVRSLFTCKHLQAAARLESEQLTSDNNNNDNNNSNCSSNDKKCKKMKYSCSGSNICNNTKVMQRPEASPSPPNKSSSSKNGSVKVTLNELNTSSSLSSSSASASFSLHSATNSSTSNSNSSTGASASASRGIMPFRKLSGCYECRMVIDPALRDPSLRSTIFSCPECGEIFMKPDLLELHLSVRHAVSELGPEDTSRNIVEIIFQSSWLNKKNPVCKIDRILKVRNTPRTISRFEEYRDGIKAKATNLPKKQPRCIADGNELLRFYCTTFMCSLGLNGSSNLCTVPNCNVCTIIKNGFKLSATDGASSTKKGILTTATSGKAHDNTRVVSNDDHHEKRAMLVCRVIAGRVKKSMEGTLEGYDSIAGAAGVYSNLDELFVFNPKAILPCFVVIYQGF